jgi:hypothetical protein
MHWFSVLSIQCQLLTLELIPDLGHAPVVVGKNSKQLRVEVDAEFENRLAALRDRIDREAPSSTQAPDLDPETLAQFSTPCPFKNPIPSRQIEASA